VFEQSVAVSPGVVVELCADRFGGLGIVGCDLLEVGDDVVVVDEGFSDGDLSGCDSGHFFDDLGDAGDEFVLGDGRRRPLYRVARSLSGVFGQSVCSSGVMKRGGKSGLGECAVRGPGPETLARQADVSGLD
jgi:hypothetical protein